MSAFRHTPHSAALAVRSIFAGDIAATWDQYFAPSYKLNAYAAAKIVQEQCNGPLRSEPCTFRDATLALETAIPELFAEYWSDLPA